MTKTASHKILVVDQDAAGLRFLEKILVAEGYAVAKARDGVQALDLLAGDGFSLLITDLTLPRMSGLRLLEEVRKRGAVPSIVTAASEVDTEAQRSSLAAGAHAFMVKPLDREELIRAVRDAISKGRV